MAKLHIWHRYVGVTAALLATILALTGLALNFNDRLQLDRIHLNSTWLLDYYNIGDFPVISFRAGAHIISQAGDYIYVDGNYKMHLLQKLVGATELNKDLLLATETALLLIDVNGDIIEEIGTYTGLPEEPLGISLTVNGNPVIRGINTYWQGDKELTAWRPLQGPHPKWSAPLQTPDRMDSMIQEHARSHQISLERIVLDLHSGRLLGQWGQHIMSAAAILLLLLAVTGTIMWFRK